MLGHVAKSAGNALPGAVEVVADPNALPVFVASTTAAITTTAFTIAKPDNVQEGDLLILFQRGGADVTAFGFQKMRLFFAGTPDIFIGEPWFKFAEASEPANYTATLSAAGATAALLAYRGVRDMPAWTAEYRTSASTGNNAISIPGVDTWFDALEVSPVFKTGTGTLTVPSGFVSRASRSASYASVNVLERAIGKPGLGTSSATWSSNAARAAASLRIR